MVNIKDKNLVGAAGEHLVLSRLLSKGILAAQAPRGARKADILVNHLDISWTYWITMKNGLDHQIKLLLLEISTVYPTPKPSSICKTIPTSGQRMFFFPVIQALKTALPCHWPPILSLEPASIIYFPWPPQKCPTCQLFDQQLP